MSLSIIDRDGNDWEKRVKVWLRIRYPNGEFEEVPAGHAGDYGVEGFSRDGRAYQCYAAREALKAAALYENQRIKIHDDIEKFIRNGAELQKLFGPLKIESWWFVTPEHKSAKLVQYAQKKAEEVKEAHLPYTTRKFFIHIATPEDFETEKQIAVRRGLDMLRIDGLLVDESELAEWADGNDQLIQKLDAKIRRYVGVCELEKLRELREEWLRLHINGKNVLSALRKSHPQLWEEVDRCKSQRRRYLFLNFSTSKAPPEVLREAVEKLRTSIAAKIPQIEELTLEALVYEAVADWIIECPLDFPEHAGNH